MPTGRQTISQFNTNNEGAMGSVVSGNLQSLLTKISNPQTRKHLTGLRVTMFPLNTDPIATFSDRFARLIVCTGNLPETDDSSALALFPFTTLQTISSVQQMKGIDRLIINTVVRNELSLLFNTPITIYEGENLNVLLGVAWTVGDSQAAPTASAQSLNVLGYEELPNQPVFPFRLV